jgi:hypothetical protein
LLNFNDDLAARTSYDDLKGFHNVMNALEGLMEDLEKEQK